MPASKEDDGWVVLAACECTECGEEVELLAEPVEWEDGKVTDYGPGIGEHCGKTFLLQPDGAVEVYALPPKATA